MPRPEIPFRRTAPWMLLLGLSPGCEGAYRHQLASDASQVYHRYVPERCVEASTPCPAFAFVHGSGQTGRRYLRAWRDDAEAEGFVLIAPTFRNGYQRHEGGEDEALIEMWRESDDAVRLQPGMVVSGFSGGAQFAHRFAFAWPERTRAVAAHSAGNYDAPEPTASSVPFVVTVGLDDDSRVEVAGTFVDALEDAGFDASLSELPGVGHRFSDEARARTLELVRRVAD